MNKADRTIEKSTKEGRLYKNTTDFLKQEKVLKTIDDLLKSDIVKSINDRKKLKTA